MTLAAQDSIIKSILVLKDPLSDAHVTCVLADGSTWYFLHAVLVHNNGVAASRIAWRRKHYDTCKRIKVERI